METVGLTLFCMSVCETEFSDKEEVMSVTRNILTLAIVVWYVRNGFDP